MRDAVRLASRLFILMLAAGLCLGIVDALTRGPIEEQRTVQAESMRRAVLPEADSLEPIDASEGMAVFCGRAGEEIVGYVFELTAPGFGGDLPVAVGIGSDGIVRGVRIGENSETAGLGARAAEEGFYGQFAGKEASPLGVVKGDASGQNIQAITSATATSDAVTGAVNAAIEAFLAIR